MKKIAFSLAILISFLALTACNNSSDGKKDWNLGTQAYTFRAFSFFEAVDKTSELGLNYIEAYPGQEIGGDLDGKMGYDLDKDTRKKIKQHLDKKGVEWKAFGVIVPESKEAWDSLYQFAKDMKISTIVSEPKTEDLPYLSELSDQYKVNLAIHNHPEPSPYWNPELLMEAVDGLSERVGACADFGHFARSGLDPVESLKKLEGRIIEAHIKDIESAESNSEDVIWGTGILDFSGMLQELDRQGFKGLLSVEYEADPEDNMDQIRKSIDFYNEEIKSID